MDPPGEGQPEKTLRDALESKSTRWSDFSNMDYFKRSLMNLAQRLGARIPDDALFIPHPHPGEEGHPLNREFQEQGQRDGLAPLAVSRNRKFFAKHSQRLDRDSLIELCILWLMDQERRSFPTIKGLLQRIANRESISDNFMTDLVSLANEAVNTKERFEAFNTAQNREINPYEWLCDSLVNFMQRFMEDTNKTKHQQVFEDTRQFAKNLFEELPDHFGIVSLEFFSIKETPGHAFGMELVLITEYLGVTMQASLANAREEGVTLFQKQIINVMIQMTKCLHWMHINRFIHGDPKLDNFFILEGPDRLNPLQGARIYLGDLGQSRFFDFTGSNHGYRPFKAPEFGAGRNRKTDIFALGMTLMQVICPNTMKQWVDQFEPTGRRTRNEPNVIPDVPTFDRGLHDLIVSCLNGDPARRPTTSEILQRLRAIHDDTGEDIVLPADNPPPPPSSHSSPSPSPSPSPHSSPSSSSSSSSDLNTSSYGSS